MISFWGGVRERCPFAVFQFITFELKFFGNSDGLAVSTKE